MNRLLLFLLVAVFAIFIGSQITEGVLLVPYWQSLSGEAFYNYYSLHGPSISRFYSILTITATLISMMTSIYCLINKSPALKYSMVSSFFAFLFIAFFYVYFKGTNQQFYENAFNADQLKGTLATWEYCHWLRVGLEVLSLVFLMLSFNILIQAERTIEA